MFYLLYIYLAEIFFSIVLSTPTECNEIAKPIQDRRIDNSTLRLVQFNAEWLFIDYCNASDCPGNGCSWHTLNDAQYHMSLVSEIINELQPDIVNFCEVESCNELNILINELKDTTYKPYLIKGTDTSTGQNIGIITRIDPMIDLYRTEEKVYYPIPNTACGTTSALGNTGVSKHYITELKISDKNVALIGAHLLAIPTDPSRCVQREGQAQILQNIIYSYIMKNYEIILIGDLNDYDDKTLDVNYNKPISKVLDILKGIEGDKKNTYLLSNVANVINQNERYSNWYDSDNNCDTISQNDFSMIDHVLVTDWLINHVKNAFIYHDYLEYCGKTNSDHYPVIVDFYNL